MHPFPTLSNPAASPAPTGHLRARLRGPMAALLLAALSQPACRKEEQTAAPSASENPPAQVSAGSLDTSAVLNFLSSLGLSKTPGEKGKDSEALKVEQFNAEMAHWKQRALGEFPELGRAGSGFNKMFLENYNQLKAADAPELKLPNWPYLLAVKVSAFSESEKAALLRKAALAREAALPASNAVAANGSASSGPPRQAPAAPPAPPAVIAPVPRPQAVVPAVADTPVPSNAGAGIVLEKDWATAMKDGRIVMNELRDLVAPHAKASQNLKPSPGLEIYERVTYLMPLKEAMAVLGITQQVGSQKPVDCPGFPYHSTFSYSFNGSFVGGFDTIYLVTDKAQQVVAVQFGAVSPKIKPDRIEGQTFDFVNTRTKALTVAKVFHETRKTGSDVLCIDSILLSPEGILSESARRISPARLYSFNPGYFKEMHATRLYLPRPLMELILYRAK